MEWYMYVPIVAVIIGGLTGCAGKLTDVSNDIKERREKVEQKVTEMYGKYQAATEVYISVRNRVREHWDKIPEDVQDKLERLDEKVVAFHDEVQKLKDELEQANKDIEKLELMAKKADKKWSEVLGTLENLSRIALKLS
jgi:chromosome segregation ATPase